MEFTLGEHTYRVEQVDAFTQLHCARRLMPLQIAMGLSSQKIASALKADESTLLQFLGGPIADVVSKMPQEDFDYILKTAARASRRQQGDRWAPIMQGDNLMFKDLGMQALLRITIEFVKENLGSFFGGLGAGLPSPASSPDQASTS